MADTGHLDGSLFQGIDETATQDESSFSAALEGKLTNNSYWLHRYGAGTAVKRFIGGNNAVAVEVNRSHKSSAIWANIHQQMLIVTKGLSKVRILLQATCTGYDCDLRVMLGVRIYGQDDFKISAAGSSTQQFVVLEFDVLDEFRGETEVPLFISAKATVAPLPASMPTLHTLSVSNSGFGFDSSTGFMNDDAESAIAYFVDNGNSLTSFGAPQVKIGETIFKKLPLGYFDTAALATSTMGSYSYFEIEMSYITVRSLAIRTEYK